MKSEDFYTTIGVHPNWANEPFIAEDEGFLDKPDEYFEKIKEILRHSQHKDKFIAIGECGLHFENFDFTDLEVQVEVFEKHFELTEEFNLPLFLHYSQNGHNDLVRILKANRKKWKSGVIHSFNGSAI